MPVQGCMFDALRELKEWVLGFADSDWAAVALALSSFSDSVFSPVPPDVLLIGIGVRQPESAVWLALLATASSVAGAVVGYWLGRTVGRPLLNRLVSPEKVSRAEGMFNRYGVWAVLVAALTPLPYKVFAILAGVLRLDLRAFVVVSLIGRGARLLALGVLLYFYGESVEQFIDDNFQLVTIAVTAALFAGIAAFLVVVRLRRADTHPPPQVSSQDYSGPSQ